MTKFDTTNWRVEKIISLNKAEAVAKEHTASGRKLVTVNGTFDIIHAGHLDQLEEAKKQGDILFVGVNSDASVREAKGDTRPYITEQARAALLAALTCVDYVIIIDAAYREVPTRLIRTVKPNVHVNGPEYGKPERWVEWPAMQECGAVGYTVGKRNDISTSDLVHHIKTS